MKPHIVALAAVLAACICFQAWFLGLGPKGERLGDARLSDAYTEALAHGQSFLLQVPDPRLLAAKDPFGAATAGLMVSDTSFFRGRYYMYFGIVPFALFLLPWRLFTGTPPSPELSVLFFCALGYLAYSIVLLWAGARRFRGISTLILTAGLLGIILASGTWPLMGRPAVYEIENAAAFAFFALSIAAIARFEWGNDRPPWAIGLATGFAGAVMGCRPNYFPAVAAVAIWAILSAVKSSASKGPATAKLFKALWPMSAVALSLGCWNYIRFGSLLDFGLSHTVSADPSLVRPLSSWSNLPYLLHRYALGMPRLDRYFPFIQGPAEGTIHRGIFQEVSNQVYGFLIVCPVTLFAAVFLKRFGTKSDLGALPWVLLCSFLGNYFFLSSVPMSCYRYPADFLSPLALLAALGLFRLATSNTRFSALALTAFGATLCWTLLAVVSMTFSVAQNTENFDIRRRNDFRSAALMFNSVVYVEDRLTGQTPRSLNMQLKFPVDRSGKTDPLLVLGERGAQDFFYVYYAGMGTIRLGVEIEGLGGDLSAPISCDYSTSHTIGFRLGSFLPPDESPLFSGYNPDTIAQAHRIVVLTVDGIVVFDRKLSPHPYRAQEYVGCSPDNAAFGSKFHGNIIRVSREQMPVLVSPERWNPSAYGPLQIAATPANLPNGVLEPLVSLGYQNDGAQILARRVDPETGTLIWVTTHGIREESPPFHWSAGRAYRLTIGCGSLYPEPRSGISLDPQLNARSDDARSRLTIDLDGNPLWSVKTLSPNVSPASRVVGKDTLFLLPGTMPTMSATLIAPVSR